MANSDFVSIVSIRNVKELTATRGSKHFESDRYK